MHAGKRYSFISTLIWSRKSILIFLILDTIPTLLHCVFDYEWLHIPWQPISLIGIAVAFYLTWQNPNVLQSISHPETVKQIVVDLGVFGPIAIVALMTLAVVFSPIPSAPIAMVSGALFGHFIGAIYRLHLLYWQAK